MGRAELSPGALLFAWCVILLGIAAGVGLLLTADAGTWNWAAIGVLAVLGLIATFVSMSYRGFLPTTITYQIGSAFAYALFLLVHPGAMMLVLWIEASADWAYRRRRPLSGLFNLGQMGLATLAATLVWEIVEPGPEAIGGFGWRMVLSAIAAMSAFLLVNHTLTNAIISFASRRRLFSLGVVQFTGGLNEVLCILSGIGMSILWQVRPWTIVFGAVPLFIHFFLLVRLTEREQELEAQKVELRSLQGLGLDIGAELDEAKLHEGVVRASEQALEAGGAALFMIDDGESELTPASHRGSARTPPTTLPVTPRVRECLAADSVARFDEPGSISPVAAEFGLPDARGMLVAPIDILGPGAGLLVVYRDSSRRAFSTEDLSRLETLVRFISVALSNARLVSDLRDMREQLIQNEKMTALGMLVSGVAHELNNPLTSVVGYTELILSRETDPKTRRMLESVANEASRAGKIVRNLLTFSRKHRPEKEPTDINEVLGQILELRAYELRVRNVEVVAQFGTALPPALVDPHQFQQVFLNLVTNAEHALDNVEGERRIVIQTLLKHGSLRVTIADNGPGIPKANHGKIFLPFFTTKEVGKGTGLGLSICYGIVQEHGGRILVESPRDGGARFTIEIPATSLVQAGPPDAAGAGDVVGRGPGRLLVVDDEPRVSELVRDAMSARGWDVASASDGVEALEILAENDFDALLVDVRMPGMDGASFYEAIHLSRPALARRIVFATGDAGDPGTQRFLESTGNPVLPKPYDLDSLYRTLADVGRRTSTGAA